MYEVVNIKTRCRVPNSIKKLVNDMNVSDVKM